MESEPIRSRVMFSTPQAITASAMPDRMRLWASMAASWEEPHWASMVMHGVLGDAAVGEPSGADDVHALGAELVDAAAHHLIDLIGLQPIALQQAHHDRTPGCPTDAPSPASPPSCRPRTVPHRR